MVVQRCHLAIVDICSIKIVLDVGLQSAAVGKGREVKQQNCPVSAGLLQGLDLCRSPLVVEFLKGGLHGDLVVEQLALMEELVKARENGRLVVASIACLTRGSRSCSSSGAPLEDVARSLFLLIISS